MTETSPRPLALITGASSGIGEAFARRLARDGYDLILVARRRSRLEALADELREGQGGAVEVIGADLTDDAQLRVVEERVRWAGELAMLINNAGFMTPKLFAHAEAETWDAMVRLHVAATVRLTRAALPGMIARGAGDIINVASVAAFVPMQRNVMYTATKRFLVCFTEGLLQETAGTGVRLQALCPGWTRTELLDQDRVDTSHVGKRWWSAVEHVVDASLRALKRRRLVVIPGWRNRMFIGLSNFTFRPLLRWMLRRNRMNQVTMKDD